MSRLLSSPPPSPSGFSTPALRFLRPVSASLLLLLLVSVSFCLPAAAATTPNLVTKPVDTGVVSTLAQHHPAWANAANQISQVPADQDLEQLTLVLARPAAQQKAFEQLLADQQNPASPSYHKWLTADEIGQRFGISDSDLAAVSSWLASQGLHVNFVSPDRVQVGFGGSASNINRAFGATLAYYNVHGQKRISVASEPTIPQALAASIQSVRGLFAIGERPYHAVAAFTSNSPEITTSKGYHFLTPADFNTIYDVPSSYTGAGYTIGIVSWARVSTTDLDNFRSLTSASFPNPTVAVPTAYGGVDPGAAYTSAPSCTNDCLGGQSEATLDVIRAGSTAPGASLLLVASSSAGANDGIGADTQYLVYKNAANIITLSFGACESQAGLSSVTFWDSLFSTAAGQGMSVFVSSGDSAAAGCDDAFSAPPTTPIANSPNYICSSSYATCVGGTQFNDTASPSTYWSSSNTTGYQSVLSYIPEGGWNESSTSSIAGSGGGVSTIIATPSWQIGTGVPSARAGRYTPDVSFSSAGHDGYFACMAASGTSTGCVVSNNSFGFIYFSGTSAAAPSMAGVAALLDQKMGAAQGNLNPKLYSLASSAPSAFHDVTVSSSGVSSCSLATPSLCNSSIYSSTAGAVQQGFLVGAGYDEVTGLGSLDVANFLSAYSATSATTTPTVTVTPVASSITTAQSLSVTVAVSGSSGTPTGSVTLSSGSYASSAALLSSGSATVTIPAGSLAAGTATLTASYAPDSASSSTYSSASGSATVTVTQATTGSFSISGSTITVSKGSSASGAITVTPVSGFTGTVALSATITASPSGAQYKPTLSFSNSSVTITGASAVTSSLTATAASTTAAVHLPPSPANHWRAAAGLALASLLLFIAPVKLRRWRNWIGSLALLFAFASILVACGGGGGGSSSGGTTTKYTPTVTVSPSASTLTTAQPLTVTTTVSGTSGTPTGSIILTGLNYVSNSTSLSGGSASISIPAGSLTAGANQSLTASYTPDTASSSTYSGASGVTYLNIQGISTTGTYTVTITGTSGSTTATTTISLVVQ